MWEMVCFIQCHFTRQEVGAKAMLYVSTKYNVALCMFFSNVNICDHKKGSPRLPTKTRTKSVHEWRPHWEAVK